MHYALASPWARDPEYTRGIIRSYVENKRLRGKTSREVAVKLNLLEKEVSFCFNVRPVSPVIQLTVL